jgi:magnesium-transporting ATPase (P-type)
MSVVVKLEGRTEKRIYAKGAPLEILECCDRVLSGGEVIPIDEAARQRIQRENDALADEGLRVLAFTYRDDAGLEGKSSYEVAVAEKGLIFLGLAAMTDPIRPEVPESIRACHTAGIRILMVTGDYALTAARIARQLGLGRDGPVQTMTGTQISEMSDADLKQSLGAGEPIFARVSPEHKLRLVGLLKEMGEIVAVTGDGVNDAPALKKADIGIAMGVRGNEVAKEAADMILIDDNFSTIVAAIEEGRAVFDNIRRFAAYVLNSNPQEMYPYIFWMLFPGVPLAMTVMGVLAVDVGTDLVPAMGLGVEPPEPGVMKRPPRRREEKLLSLGFILRSYFVQGSLLAVSCYTTYFYMGWVLGVWSPDAPASNMPPSPPGLDMSRASAAYLQTLTAYFFPTVTTQIANVLSKRSSLNSIFSLDFLSTARRQEIVEGLRRWQVPRYAPRAQVAYQLHRFSLAELGHILVGLVREITLLPLRGVLMLLSELGRRLERPLSSGARWLGRLLEAHPVLLNFVSNPLILFGIAFELLFCWILFYSPLSKMYFFEPVPWHVYLFAFHGTVLLLAFEEGKKYLRRRGYKLRALN